MINLLLELKFDLFIRMTYFVKMESDNSARNIIINMVITLGCIVSLSFARCTFCNWYGCNSMMSFMGTDMICNACVDVAYHLKNYQIALYGSVFTLLSYKMTNLVNLATSSKELIFKDYSLGINSPRKLGVED